MRELYGFQQLSGYLDSIGCPPIVAEKGFKLIKGIDFEKAYKSGDISFEDDGIYLEYEGVKYRGYMFISHYYVRFNGQPAKFPKFHLVKCHTIQEFINSGRFKQRYEWSNSSINDITDIQSGDEYKDEVLGLCKYCKDLLIENDTLFDKGSGTDINDTEEFHRLLDKSQIAQEGIQVDLFGYVKDKEKISRQYRRSRDFTCENCGIKSERKLHNRYWHTHHIDGDKTHNNFSNLKCLCVVCHANVDEGHRKNFSVGRMQVEIKSFLKHYRDKLKKLNNPYMDRAVNVYHLRRVKVSSANQVHEIDSFWC